MTVEFAATEAVSTLDSSADTHAKTLAVSQWMQRNLRRTTFEPAQPPERTLSSGRMDASGAAALFRAMLSSLGIQTRVMLATGSDGVSWYPIVEVLDPDGDHAWDPLYGRYAPDYDDTPLPVARWATAETVRSTADDLTAPAIQEPSLQALARTAGAPLQADRAYVTRIELSKNTRLGTADASDAEFTAAPEAGGAPGAALAAVGDRALHFGSGTFALRFVFPAGETGATLTLRYGLTEGSPRDLLVIATGATLVKRDDLHRSLSFALDATTASVTLGAHTGRRAGFDYLWWSGL